jgi:hypothetical protein
MELSAPRGVNERDVICATESEFVVGLDAITLGAPFHRIVFQDYRIIGSPNSLHQIRKARVVVENSKLLS